MVGGAGKAALCALVLAPVAVLATGCSAGGGSAQQPALVASGQLSPGEIPVGAGSHAGSGGGSAGTVPLAKQSPTTALFTAIGTFQSCLKGLGVTFIGAPNPNDPTSPANDPTYLKHLATCATRSNILQALKNAESAQNNLTPAQVEKENKDYLRWRTCMISRGWGVPKPTPNAKGLLFSFGGTGGGAGAGITPPPGQNPLTSKDLQECAAQSQQGRP